MKFTIDSFKNVDPVDAFAFPGAESIQEESHCGIVNGLLAPGTPYRRLAMIQGLWAPPYVSTDFRFDVKLFGKEVPCADYTWWPFKIEGRGQIDGLSLTTVTALVPGRRALVMKIECENTTGRPIRAPLACEIGGTLDRDEVWFFKPPVSQSATTPSASDGALVLRQGAHAIVVREASGGVKWETGTDPAVGRLELMLAPGGRVTVFLVIAIGAEKDAVGVCRAVAADPEKALRDAHETHRVQVRNLFAMLPRLSSSNPDFDRWYHRSLVHLLLNRWDVPEFALRPYYGTGSVRGGCICCYLWNYGELWEIMPLYNPEANREHIRQFLRNDMMAHLAWEPVKGRADGPWYPVNQEKLVGLIHYHVKVTGDVGFLDERVGERTVLEHAIAQALCRDDLSRPVELIDYGPANDHLELRRGILYNHVMPDLNARRYEQYMMAAKLSKLAGKPRPDLERRAAGLKQLIRKELWNEKTQWFDFITPKGRDIRWTNQMFKLFNSGVLDADMEAGLLGHLNEREFLSAYGLHSLAKHDVAYDVNDVDNGGPGSCTSFPPQIAERLYKAGKAEPAADMLRRCLWWGAKLPYWSDSMVADAMDYRRDTPLQCMVDGAAIAQGVVFGVFGIEACFDGTIVVAPSPPPFAPEMTLTGVRLRGRTFDVRVTGGRLEVRCGMETHCAKVGQAVRFGRGGGRTVNSEQ